MSRDRIVDHTSTYSVEEVVRHVHSRDWNDDDLVGRNFAQQKYKHRRINDHPATQQQIEANAVQVALQQRHRPRPGAAHADPTSAIAGAGIEVHDHAYIAGDDPDCACGDHHGLQQDGADAAAWSEAMRGPEWLPAGRQPQDYAERLQRREELWAEVRTRASSNATAHAARLASLRSSASCSHLQLLQQHLDTLPFQHACCEMHRAAAAQDHAIDGPVVMVMKHRPVTYVSFDAYGALQVPEFTCSWCGEQEVPPEMLGCTPSAPLAGRIWVDNVVLQFAARAQQSGLSATAMADCISTVLSCVMPGTPKPLISPQLIEEALGEWQITCRDLENPDAAEHRLQGDPVQAVPGMVACPGCAVVPGTVPPSQVSSEASAPSVYPVSVPPELSNAAEQLQRAQSYEDCAAAIHAVQEHVASSSTVRPPTWQPGEGRPPLLGVTADGNHKATRFAKAGHQAAAIPGHMQRFLGRANKLAPDFVSMYREARDGLPPAEHEEGPCTTQITCSRESAAGGGMFDRRGLLGFACTCGTPIRELFVSMTTPEQHAYYVLCMQLLQQERAVQLLGTDISCKLLPGLQRMYREGQPGSELWQNTRFCTGYMHGSSHVMSCVCAFHAAFAAGFGRAVLENMEQLFAELKPTLKLCKYMSPGRYEDTLDTLLHNIEQRKVLRYPTALVHTYTALKKREAELSQRLQTLQRQASELQLDLSTAAVPPGVQAQPHGSRRLMQSDSDLKETYVGLLMKVRALDALQENSAAYDLALSTRASQLLHAQAHDSSRRGQTEQRLQQLEVKLGITQRWGPGHAGYEEYRQRVIQGRISDYRSRVSDQLDNLKCLRVERVDAGAASKSTVAIDKRIKRARQRLDNLLRCLEAQEDALNHGQQAGDAAAAAGDQGRRYNVVQVIEQGVPWIVGDQHGRNQLWLQFQLVQNEQQRCTEEHALLKAKAGNALAQLQHLQLVCLWRVYTAQSVADEAVKEMLATPANAQAGQRYAELAKEWAVAQGSSWVMSKQAMLAAARCATAVQQFQAVKWLP